MAYPNEPHNPYARVEPRGDLDYRRPGSRSGGVGIAIGAVVVALLIGLMLFSGASEEPLLDPAAPNAAGEVAPAPAPAPSLVPADPAAGEPVAPAPAE
ncbi:hypothetical protein [Pararhodobacter aggregans]|uniref:hypothetical protein n=1 Tax=Pararhodobacter aggregans TaxID=404875 RepID=UPI000D46F40D|nr:hypothetical protein [Pararhodobacter aggregans]PTX00775.1 hypothetical protein C8N33_109119 [Pararhodobacter aggregans]